MDSDSNTFKLCKLHADNSHSWKYRFELVLSIKDLTDYMHDDATSPESPKYNAWSKGDAKSLATIGLTLTD